MRKVIIPAVIAKRQEELDEILSKISHYATLIQLDIMDGKFVPNRSLDFDFRLAENNFLFEAHLMIENPLQWVEGYGGKVDTVIAHFEAIRNPEVFIEAVKGRGKKAAFALNPETEIHQMRDYLFAIDQVLVMTVHPGFYGSKFLPEVMDKIRRLRDLRPDLDIEVDGGIKPDTIGMVDEAGANMFVSGSYLIRSDDLRERMEILRARIGD
jgi:ribulose-phosphate 3-epimerase